MKRFIGFGKIRQFRDIVASINKVANYDLVELPKVSAIATEKIHGTNAAVCYGNKDGFWTQSRKNIITPEKDNAACSFNAYGNKDKWMEVIETLAKENGINLDYHIISVYYEWAGGNIQSKSALSGVEKSSMIFQYFKVSPVDAIIEDGEEVESSVWLEVGNIDFPSVNIYNIINFPTYEIDIDFSTPSVAQNKLVKLVDEVIEPKSPVGVKFEQGENIGEGVVVTFEWRGIIYRFKVKGEEHSKSKVKKLKEVDEVFEQVKVDFANYAASPSRLEQAWQNIFGINNEIQSPSIEKTGDFIRLVIKDVMEEEQLEMKEKGLEPKQVNGLISRISANWFKTQLSNNF